MQIHSFIDLHLLDYSTKIIFSNEHNNCVVRAHVLHKDVSKEMKNSHNYMKMAILCMLLQMPTQYIYREIMKKIISLQ